MEKVKFLWNIVRYFLATIISTVVTGVIPFAVASIPLVFALVWVILWAIVILFAFFGVNIDVPMDEPIGIVIVPLLASILGAISVSVAVLLTIAFNFIIVLPFSIFVEILNKRFGLRNWFFRLGTFFSGGIVLGFLVGIAGTLVARKIDTEISLLGQIGTGVFLGVTCVVAEFVFGFTLMVTDLAQKVLKAGKRAFFPQSTSLAQQKNA